MRVARPTESGTAGVPSIHDESFGVGATVTTVRTASQAMRRAISGWIGPTPPNSAACATATTRSVSSDSDVRPWRDGEVSLRVCSRVRAQRVRTHREREMRSLPVHIAVLPTAQLRGRHLDERVGAALRRQPACSPLDNP